MYVACNLLNIQIIHTTYWLGKREMGSPRWRQGGGPFRHSPPQKPRYLTIFVAVPRPERQPPARLLEGCLRSLSRVHRALWSPAPTTLPAIHVWCPRGSSEPRGIFRKSRQPSLEAGSSVRRQRSGDAGEPTGCPEAGEPLVHGPGWLCSGVLEIQAGGRLLTPHCRCKSPVRARWGGREGAASCGRGHGHTEAPRGS